MEVCEHFSVKRLAKIRRDFCKPIIQHIPDPIEFEVPFCPRFQLKIANGASDFWISFL